MFSLRDRYRLITMRINRQCELKRNYKEPGCPEVRGVTGCVRGCLLARERSACANTSDAGEPLPGHVQYSARRRGLFTSPDVGPALCRAEILTGTVWYDNNFSDSGILMKNEAKPIYKGIDKKRLKGILTKNKNHYKSPHYFIIVHSNLL